MALFHATPTGLIERAEALREKEANRFALGERKKGDAAPVDTLRGRFKSTHPRDAYMAEAMAELQGIVDTVIRRSA